MVTVTSNIIYLLYNNTYMFPMFPHIPAFFKQELRENRQIIKITFVKNSEATSLIWGLLFFAGNMGNMWE